MKNFYVIKESGTFSDSIECLGFAKILKTIIKQISKNEDEDILIEDKGGYFELISDVDITEDAMSEIKFFDFMPYVTSNNKNNKEDTSKLSFPFINYHIEKEINDKFYKLKLKERKKSNNPPRSDYDIIRLYAGMDGYRKSFHNWRAFQNNYSQILNYILKYYSSEFSKRYKIERKISNFVKKEKFNICKVNALQDIDPDKGKGTNREKADSIMPKAYANMLWFRQLIKFAGGWQCLTSRYINKDYKTYGIMPYKISLEYMNKVFTSFKESIYGNKSIKIDILMILNLMQKLILNYKSYKESWNIFQPSHVISGLQFAYYKKLGPKPGVTNIGFLCIPDFIVFKDGKEAQNWIEIIEEHQVRINSINEKNSLNIRMLQSYRNFISASNFNSFFEFNYDYGNFLISSISNGKYYIKSFSIKNMEVLMKTNEKFENIFSNKGFKAIADAIRNSTIVPIIHKNKKDVVFGLSNKLKIASRNKDSLVTEISNFIQKYNKSLMIKDYHNQQHYKYVTTEELEEFYKLLDSDNSSKIVSGMLVAFGYARNSKVEDEVKS